MSQERVSCISLLTLLAESHCECEPANLLQRDLHDETGESAVNKIKQRHLIVYIDDRLKREGAETVGSERSG